MVPRLILAMGVIVWALLMVLLTRRRRPAQPARLPPTCDDPVAEVLAGARPVSRRAGEQLDVDDLRWIVTVEEWQPADEGGCNTIVGLDDTVSSYAEVFADGLEDALADQPGIDAAHHADREVILVRSLLSLPDVQAAAIRALLAINRRPQVPRDRPLPAAMLNTLADSVAAIMAGHGFTGRLPMTGERDRDTPAFSRLLDQGRLVQTLRLHGGFGHHRDDGTIVNACLTLTVEIGEIGEIGETGETGETGGTVISASYDRVPVSVEGIEQILAGKALPLCRSTTSRAAIVDRWVRGLPWHVPDRPYWEAADIAARWGFRGHARDLLKHTPRNRKQAAAVAARHNL